MHELGVLRHTVRTVSRLAQEHHIRQIKHITLEVGEDSGYVHYYLQKLFPVAADACPCLQGTQLILHPVPGRNLVIRDIGY